MKNNYDLNKDVQCCEVIISKQLTRGNGTTEPFRRITQVLTKSGELIAENDSDTFVKMDLVHFARYVSKLESITIQDVNKWIDSNPS
jgi:hypothetical protein